MYQLFSFFVPFIATAEGQGGFPRFHFYAIPLLILLGLAIGWFARGRREKGKTR